MPISVAHVSADTLERLLDVLANILDVDNNRAQLADFIEDLEQERSDITEQAFGARCAGIDKSELDADGTYRDRLTGLLHPYEPSYRRWRVEGMTDIEYLVKWKERHCGVFESHWKAKAV